MLDKLYKYGARGRPRDWFASYLLDRKQLANSSNKLSFRLFADDANFLYTSDDINDIESVMNCEITRVLNYHSINKLSVNMVKWTVTTDRFS